MAKKTNKKVFFMKKKATAKVSKVAKLKKFFGNTYVQAALTGAVGAAGYVITEAALRKILGSKTSVTVEEKTDAEVVTKETVSVGTTAKSMQLYSYTFSNYDKHMYVCPKFRRPLEDNELALFKELDDEAELIDALKKHPDLYSLYVG
jgi:hypothetical protein